MPERDRNVGLKVWLSLPDKVSSLSESLAFSSLDMAWRMAPMSLQNSLNLPKNQPYIAWKIGSYLAEKLAVILADILKWQVEKGGSSFICKKKLHLTFLYDGLYMGKMITITNMWSYFILPEDCY